MKKIITERNCVIFLFAVTFFVFVLAKEDGKRLDRLFPTTTSPSSASSFTDTSQHASK